MADLLCRCILLLTAATTVTACRVDADCGPAFYCSTFSHCIHVPEKVGDLCREDSQCLAFDPTSVCVNATCHVAPSIAKNRKMENGNSVVGTTVSALIIMYALVPIGICVAVVVTIVCTLRSRADDSLEQEDNRRSEPAAGVSVSYSRSRTLSCRTSSAPAIVTSRH